MKYYIQIALILLVLSGVGYIIFLQSTSITDSKRQCEANGWTSLWKYSKIGKVYSNVNFCVDKNHFLRIPPNG